MTANPKKCKSNLLPLIIIASAVSKQWIFCSRAALVAAAIGIFPFPLGVWGDGAGSDQSDAGSSKLITGKEEGARHLLFLKRMENYLVMYLTTKQLYILKVVIFRKEEINTLCIFLKRIRTL